MFGDLVARRLKALDVGVRSTVGATECLARLLDVHASSHHTTSVVDGFRVVHVGLQADKRRSNRGGVVGLNGRLKG